MLCNVYTPKANTPHYTPQILHPKRYTPNPTPSSPEQSADLFDFGA